MVIKIQVLLLFLTISVLAYPSDLAKAPKHYSVEMGYRYLPSTTFDMKTQGATLLFDYAWQLSGFNGKPAGYISVPLGYTSFFAGGNGKQAGILSYGWTVRHDLKANCNTIPYFGYGLLLNQLRLGDVDGSSFGHQTRFDFGVQFQAQKRISPFVKAEYSYTRYPTLGVKESNKIHAFEVKGGLRF